jgi:hypothetical protein
LILLDQAIYCGHSPGLLRPSTRHRITVPQDAPLLGHSTTPEATRIRARDESFQGEEQTLFLLFRARTPQMRPMFRWKTNTGTRVSALVFVSRVALHLAGSPGRNTPIGPPPPAARFAACARPASQRRSRLSFHSMLKKRFSNSGMWAPTHGSLHYVEQGKTSQAQSN